MVLKHPTRAHLESVSGALQIHARVISCLLVPSVHRCQLVQVKQRYRNGAVDFYKFNVESMAFEEESARLPPVRTKLEAYQRV